MTRPTIALDLAKNVFEIAVSHQPGRVVGVLPQDPADAD